MHAGNDDELASLRLNSGGLCKTGALGMPVVWLRVPGGGSRIFQPHLHVLWDCSRPAASPWHSAARLCTALVVYQVRGASRLLAQQQLSKLRALPVPCVWSPQRGPLRGVRGVYRLALIMQISLQYCSGQTGYPGSGRQLTSFDLFSHPWHARVVQLGRTCLSVHV